MYQGNRRPNNVPKDEWGYHLDAPEISRQFIPYLVYILGKSITPAEAEQMVPVTLFPEYFTVRVPGNLSSEVKYLVLSAAADSLIIEQPARLISLDIDDDSIQMTFIRQLRVDPKEAYQ